MEPFKNNISPELVICFADHLETRLDGFDRATFENAILETLPALELKARAALIADHLHQVLPKRHKTRAKIIRDLLYPHKVIPQGQQSDDQGITGWGMLPLSMVVGKYGLDDFEGSLLLLKDMTRHFSSEFDVRYYLQADQGRALAIMRPWVTDSDPHVRLLVSEGTRPRLPWGIRLPGFVADPLPLLPLLSALKDDESDYVRRSVANNLNDIAKDHPDLVAGIAEGWLKHADDNRRKLVRHACRSLIKQGHKKTLRALGYHKPLVVLDRLEIQTPEVRLGDSLIFDLQLSSIKNRTQKLIIDYVIHHRKANGMTSPKVFKWKHVTVPARECLAAEKKHAIKKITTRRYYAGWHALEILVNGVSMGRAEFKLVL